MKKNIVIAVRNIEHVPMALLRASYNAQNRVIFFLAGKDIRSIYDGLQERGVQIENIFRVVSKGLFSSAKKTTKEVQASFNELKEFIVFDSGRCFWFIKAIWKYYSHQRRLKAEVVNIHTKYDN